MASSIYTNVIVYVDNELLTENSQVSISGKSGKSIVNTIYSGFSGISFGAAIDEISLTMAVPSNDFGNTLNPSELVHDINQMKENPARYTVWHKITIIAASKTYETDCVFMDYSMDADVNSPTNLKFTINAKPALFK